MLQITTASVLVKNIQLLLLLKAPQYLFAVRTMPVSVHGTYNVFPLRLTALFRSVTTTNRQCTAQVFNALPVMAITDSDSLLTTVIYVHKSTLWFAVKVSRAQ